MMKRASLASIDPHAISAPKPKRNHPQQKPNKKIIAFGWYGGKFSHLDWLLPLLPPAHHYCEPFAGSAAVLLNRSPDPVETYNDIDGEVVNFFRVLRNQKEALLEAIGLTPFSREEFALALAGSRAIPLASSYGDESAVAVATPYLLLTAFYLW